MKPTPLFQIAIVLSALTTTASWAQSEAADPNAASETAVLRILNTKANKVRQAVLQARAEYCIELSHTCAQAQKSRDENSYVFSKKDIFSIVSIGEGTNSDPCKSEICEGEDSETRQYAVLVNVPSIARWGRGPTTSLLRLTFEKLTHQRTGKIKNSVSLDIPDNALKQ